MYTIFQNLFQCKPLAKILLNRDATITICYSKTSKKQIHKFASIADIIIIAIG